MRVYPRLFVAGFAQQATYRLAAVGGLVANTAFGFLKLAVLLAAVRAAGGELAGYDARGAAAYTWLSQALLGSVNLFGRSEIGERIKSGDVVVDFLRPLDVQAASVVTAVGAGVFALLPRAVPSVLIGLAWGHLALPTAAAPWVLGTTSVLLGITLSCTTVYLVAATGFWLVETRGVQVFYLVLSGFLAGLFVPLALFPAWLHALAEATPFPSMLMTPIDVLSAHRTGADALAALGAQVAWLVGTAAVGQWATRTGRRRLEVQGG